MKSYDLPLFCLYLITFFYLLLSDPVSTYILKVIPTADISISYSIPWHLLDVAKKKPLGTRSRFTLTRGHGFDNFQHYWYQILINLWFVEIFSCENKITDQSNNKYFSIKQCIRNLSPNFTYFI